MEEYLSEKEQWEWLKAQVRSNAPAALLAVLLVVGGVAGWRWYQQHQDAARLEAGARYMQILQHLEKGEQDKAFALVAQLEHDTPDSPYTDQARLLAARVYVDTNDFDKAATMLAAVASQSKDPQLAVIARQRLARVQIAQGKPDAALETLKGTEGGAFAARYHEVRGDALYAKGDKAGALTEYQAALEPGSADAQLLQLKIADLGAAPPAAKGDPAAASVGK
ncbi:MAG: tetratricopeptide repeat protein [Proteobacteria bacterium]|nr:tetratricopeptide repeat protein [Pseudomonadota bacterium]